MVEKLALPFLALGTAAVAIGLLWLLIVAFRTGFLKKALLPVFVVLLGAGMALSIPIYNRLYPTPVQTTGAEEKKTNSEGVVEERLTLTGAAREEYAKLKGGKKYAVVQWANKDVTDEDAAVLKEMAPLREIDLNDTVITDKTVEILMELKNLEVVRVERTAATISAVEKLPAALPKLRELYVRGIVGAKDSAALKTWKEADKTRKLIANK